MANKYTSTPKMLKDLANLGYTTEVTQQQDYFRPWVKKIYHDYPHMSFIVKGTLVFDEQKQYYTILNPKVVINFNGNKPILSDKIICQHFNIQIDLIDKYFDIFEIDALVGEEFYVLVTTDEYKGKDDTSKRYKLNPVIYADYCPIYRITKNENINELRQASNNYNTRINKLGYRKFKSRQYRSQRNSYVGVRTLEGITYF